MAWIKIHGELWDSWKIPNLCTALKISETQAVGHLVSLWCFTERNAWETGDLSKWGAAGIERAARWAGDPGKLILALQGAGFLDDLTVHAWEEHQAQLIYDRARWRKSTSREPLEKHARPTDLDKIREEKIRGDKRREETALAQSAPRSALPLPPGKELIQFPLPGGEELPITDSALPTWQQAYPGVDIHSELAKMRAWLLANPAKRKTRKGVARFIVTWLDKAQNDSSGRHGPRETKIACAPIPGKYDNVGKRL